MNTLHEWAVDWNISPRALADLRTRLCVGDLAPPKAGLSEAAVQAAVRVEASMKGMRLWRNNVGASYDDRGNFLRYGLANESQAMNRVIKSGDLIGVQPVVVTLAHVGTTIGQFLSVEVKEATWRYSGTDREKAQMAWAALVESLGGRALIVNREGAL